MVVKDEIRYKIDVLLRMANITSDKVKREEYLLTIEELLSCAGTPEKSRTFELPFGNDDQMKSVNDFVVKYGQLNIIGKTVSEVYTAYQEFCTSVGVQQVSNLTFSKYLRRITGIYSMQKWIENKNVRVYRGEF